MAAARLLPHLDSRAALASVGTDGVDGPTDAAGAIVTAETAARAARLGLPDPERVLNDKDSYEFLDRVGDLVRFGATDTNVGDLQVLLLA